MSPATDSDLGGPFEFHQTQCNCRVSDVDYDAEVRSTLHAILWRQKPNGSHQRMIRILAYLFKFYPTKFSDKVSGVDYDGEVC